MKRYVLSKNFTIIEAHEEALIYFISNNEQKLNGKKRTLYLNKTSLFILKKLLENKTTEVIISEIKETYLIIEESENDLKEEIEKIIESLEKAGVLNLSSQ